MAAPVIDEVLLPGFISRGAQGGDGFRTIVVTTASGAEQRVQQWADPRAEWTISLDQRDNAGFALLLAFWKARGGRARGFRYHDQSDYVATNEPLYPAGQNALNPVKGSPTAQLVKTYADSVNPYVRNIFKPTTSPAVTLRKNGSNLAYSSIDTTTGVVSLNVLATQVITGISQAASAVVTFGGAPVFANGDLVFFSGVVGMVGINGLVGQVTAVGGSTITVNIASTGFAAYVSGGSAAKYAAATDSFDWSGNWDVPVRFDQDLAGFVIQDVNWKDQSSVRIIELKG